MSQLNVDALKNASGTGNGIDVLSSGNFNFDANTLYVDSTNNRIGVNNASPDIGFDVNGSDGVNFNTAPLIEKASIVSGSSNGNTDIDILTSNVYLYTSANTGNWTPNFRGNSSTSLINLVPYRSALTVVLISPCGGSSGYISNITVDGSSMTEYWLKGAAPTARGGTSGFDVYQFSFFRESTSTSPNTAFTVFASQTHLS